MRMRVFDVLAVLLLAKSHPSFPNACKCTGKVVLYLHKFPGIISFPKKTVKKKTTDI